MQSSLPSGLPNHDPSHDPRYNPNLRSPSPSSLPGSLSGLSSLSSLSNRMRSEPLECPKCGKRSIVTRSPHTFDCLNCNFHKQLPPVVSPPLKSFQQRQRSFSYALEPNQKFTHTIDSVSETDKAGPLLFAAAAVVVGILLL